MQIQTGYSSNTLSATAPDKTLFPAGRNQANENSGIESSEYKAILNNASILLSNPHITALERLKILNLLARGEIAAASGATGELNNLLNERKKFDPALAVKDNSFQKETSKPQGTSNKQDENSVAYQDQSGDAGVSF